MKYLVIGFFGLGLALVVWHFAMPMMTGSGSGSVDVRVPKLSAAAAEGRELFDRNCASCHGKNAAGTDKGPPLVHEIYNPGHHGDGAFYRAVEKGVPQHHWPFGNMPPQPQVSREDVTDILRYVRVLQRANGIRYREHRM